MLYTFLISIVFIAELIIAFTLLRGFWKLDKIIISADETVTELKPEVRDISELTKKISIQLVELSEDFRFKVKRRGEDTALKILNKTLIAILLWKININAVRKFRRSKVGRVLSRGLNLLVNMV